MDLKAMTKAVEKFTLREELTLEQLYDVMMQSGIQFPSQFKLTKGLLGKAIDFEVYMQVLPKVTIKNNVVTVRRTESKSTISVLGSPGVDLKAQKQGREAAKQGGFMKSITGGQDYFNDVCDLMRQALSGRTVD